MALSDALTVILRYVIAAAMGWLVNKGLVDAGQSSSLTDASAVIVSAGLAWAVTVGWALWRSRFKAKVQDVLANPGVSTIHADPATVATLNVSGVVPTPL